MARDDQVVARAQRSRAQTRVAYDRISRWYDWLAADWEKEPREFALRQLEPREGERIMEIGFGTGQSLLALAQAVGETGKVYGIDLSTRMVEISRARVDRARLTRRVELDCGDATRLPFGAGFFDAVFISFVLELFDTPEIPTVVSECRRVVKPGGRVCVVSLSKVGGASRMRDVYEWGHAHFPRLLDCRPSTSSECCGKAGCAFCERLSCHCGVFRRKSCSRKGHRSFRGVATRGTDCFCSRPVRRPLASAKRPRPPNVVPCTHPVV